MSKYDGDAVRIIQLAVLSALVDGQASAEEIDTIAVGMSKYCGMEAENAKTLATKMISRYVSQKLSTDPIAIIRHGKNAMQRLSGRNRRIAMDIATQVAAATPGGEAKEAKFLRGLVQIARS